jgi:hypothetical protein
MRKSLLLLVMLPFFASAGEFRPLFDGRTLEGWKHVGEGGFIVADGLLRSRGGMGLLYWSKQKFGNAVIRIVFRTKGKNDNSGVFIRIPLEPREPMMPVHYGYEVQIDSEPERWGEDDHHYTGALYSFTLAKAKPAKPGPEWNTMEITMKGPRTTVTVNGVTVTDFKEGDPVPDGNAQSPRRGARPNQGYIGLQNHSDQDTVDFKEVSVKELK